MMCKMHSIYELIFHNWYYTPQKFAEWLRKRKIDTLIYTGFCSNLCILGRKMGIIYIRDEGFRLFFVPEASAAAEMEGTWESRLVHFATTLTISRWLAGVLHIDLLIQALSP